MQLSEYEITGINQKIGFESYSKCPPFRLWWSGGLQWEVSQVQSLYTVVIFFKKGYSSSSKCPSQAVAELELMINFLMMNRVKGLLVCGFKFAVAKFQVPKIEMLEQ